MASDMQKRFLKDKCESCLAGSYELPENGQEWHLVCDSCRAIKFCYVPMPHQYNFHRDSHKYKMFAGGFGSGKTITGCAETIRHVMQTPRGRTLIGAATLPQLEQTAQKEFFEMFPKELIVYHNKQKNYIITENGHTVLFRPLDDEGKARSLNLSMFWIEEASEVKESYFRQLQTRLRNNATKHHQGIITSNPDMGWIRTDFLLKADEIHNTDTKYFQEERINTYSVHIAPTELNHHLPDNYYRDTIKGKPDWWIRRYMKGSFENREGLVYQQAKDHIVEPFKIPEHWERGQATDFGLTLSPNKTALIQGNLSA